MTKSAFCAESHAGYRRKSAGNVTDTATTQAATPATPTATCHQTLSRHRPRPGDKVPNAHRETASMSSRR
jgi:hypothetical protein